MRTLKRRLLFIIIICFFFSFIVTLATYFYSYDSPSDNFAVTLVNRGLPLSWAVESHGMISVYPPPTIYPFNFLALNFVIDVVFLGRDFSASVDHLLLLERTYTI